MKHTSTSTYHNTLVSALNRAQRRRQEILAEVKSLGKRNDNNALFAQMDLMQAEEVERAEIVIWSYTCLEALINLYLSMNLKTKEFDEVDKLSTVGKWAVGPRFVNPEFRDV